MDLPRLQEDEETPEAAREPNGQRAIHEDVHDQPVPDQVSEPQEIPIVGWVVVEGTLADGFTIWGPFDSPEQAGEYGQAGDEAWCVMPILEAE
jgi:hypothetical protein